MNEYNFEEFKSVGSRYNMVITFSKSERFYLGGAFTRKYNIGSMVGVKLLYDKSKNAIGFRFIKEKEEGCVELKKLQQDDSYYINAKAFLGMYDISTTKFVGRYHPTEIINADGNKIFVIDLKEEINQ